MNKIIISGYIGRDPEIKYLPSGDPVRNSTDVIMDRFEFLPRSTRDREQTKSETFDEEPLVPPILSNEDEVPF